MYSTQTFNADRRTKQEEDENSFAALLSSNTFKFRRLLAFLCRVGDDHQQLDKAIKMIKNNRGSTKTDQPRDNCSRVIVCLFHKSENHKQDSCY